MVFSIVVTKHNRTGLTVAQDVKMATEEAECGFDLVEQLLVHLDFGGLEFKID